MTGNDRVDQALTAMRAFADMPGPWYEGEKRQAYAEFEAAYEAATVPECMQYQDIILGEIRQKHGIPRQLAAAGPAAAVTDLAEWRARRAETGITPETASAHRDHLEPEMEIPAEPDAEAELEP
jgi:hypothetical protein